MNSKSLNATCNWALSLHYFQEYADSVKIDLVCIGLSNLSMKELIINIFI